MKKLISKNQQAFLWVIMITLIILINAWRNTEVYNRPKIVSLPAVPSEMEMQFIASSDQAFVYRILTFWLQQFDVQAGQYVSFRDLDYQKISGWLETINKLDHESQYPMMLATRVYTRVADEKRIRIMLEHVFKQYQLNPGKNWRWLAEATVTAQHKLKDQTLALRFASALAADTSNEIPYWAKDMRLTILESMGELEQVKLLVGGLIANQTITDANEIRFLDALLKRIEENNIKSDQ